MLRVHHPIVFEKFIPWEQPLLAELDNPIRIRSVDTIPIEFFTEVFLVMRSHHQFVDL